MKLMKHFFAILFAACLITSCTEDDGSNPGSVRPSSSITPATATIPAGGTFVATLSASEGDSPLSSLTIQKDGTSLTASDISIDGNVQTSNPLSLTGALKTSFIFVVTIQTDLASGELANYSFITAAENGDVTTETVAVNVLSIPPTLTVSGGNAPITCPASALKSLEFVGAVGGSDLSTIAVYEGNSLIDTARLEFGGVNFSANPQSLTGDDVLGFTQNIVFRTHAQDTTLSYVFILTDANGLSDSVTIDVTSQSGTPLTTITADTMWNFNGANLSSFQIPNFNIVAMAETNWDLRDNGNNDGDWNGTFRVNPAHNLDLRRVTAVTFDALTTYEEIETAFAAATATGGTSDEVFLNDIYIVSKDGELYAMQAIQVIETTSDNLDYYVFSVKKR